MFHKHAIAHAHTCLYTSGQPKRAKMTTNRKIVLKLQALYYKRKKKSTNVDNTFLQKIAISIRFDIPKNSRYRYDSIYRNSTTTERGSRPCFVVLLMIIFIESGDSMVF